MFKKLMVVGIFALLTACGGGVGTSTGGNNSSGKGEPIMPVGALMSEYSKDKAATNAKYTGKTLVVKGYTSVPPMMPTGTDDKGILSLYEKGGDMMLMMVCTFDNADKEAFKQVTGDHTVTVRGVYNDDTSTGLKSCKLVEVSK